MNNKKLVKYTVFQDYEVLVQHDKGEFYRVLEVDAVIEKMKTHIDDRDELLREVLPLLKEFECLQGEHKNVIDVRVMASQSKIEKLLGGAE